MSIEQSRRDDLESLFYILISAIKGRLPWQGLVVYDDETRMRKIAEIKGSITPEKLTEGLSSHLTSFFKYVKRLKFHEAPDYKALTQMLHDTAEERGIRLDDHVFEWVASRSPQQRANPRSASGITSGLDLPKKMEDGFTDQGENPLDKKKPNTVNYLEIPNGLTPTGKDSENTTSPGEEKGFNSKIVKVSSINFIFAAN